MQKYWAKKIQRTEFHLQSYIYLSRSLNDALNYTLQVITFCDKNTFSHHPFTCCGLPISRKSSMEYFYFIFAIGFYEQMQCWCISHKQFIGLVFVVSYATLSPHSFPIVICFVSNSNHFPFIWRSRKSCECDKTVNSMKNLCSGRTLLAMPNQLH